MRLTHLQIASLLAAISLAIVARLMWGGYFTSASIALALFGVGLGVGYLWSRRDSR